MVCLGLERRRQDGRPRWIHWAVHPMTYQTMLLQMWDTIFLKGKSWPLYVISFALFTIQIKHKMMLAWGLEPGAEDGRCRRIYWNIKSPPRVPYLNDISFNDISYDYILYMTLGRKLANSPFFNYEIGNGRRRQHAVSDCPKKKTNFLLLKRSVLIVGVAIAIVVVVALHQSWKLF